MRDREVYIVSLDVFLCTLQDVEDLAIRESGLCRSKDLSQDDGARNHRDRLWTQTMS